MSDHKTKRGSARRLLSSTRVRAALSLGVVLGIGTVGTFAYWTDNVSITGTTFSAGTLDLQVNNADSYATTTLSMAAMAPGASSAEILTVKNNGTIPLKYTMTGGLAGTDAALYSSSAALSLTVKTGATKSGTGNAATCTGGTALVSAVPLTNTLTTAIIATRQGPIAAAGTQALCFQVTFDANAASNLQGKNATATFTMTGTSDVS